MKCRNIKRAVRSLICGENADTDSIREHLSACPRCKRKYASVLNILRCAEGVSIPPPDEETWRHFSGRLRERISGERPAPFGRWRSILVSAGQWKVIRLRRAAAASVAALVLAVTLLAVLSPFTPRGGVQNTIARHGPAEIPQLIPGLSPELQDVISIFGPDGFVSGVFSGYIQPGDFYDGHELNEHEIIEALDYLLS